MQTILGPFHPDLEDAFVTEILRLKETDLLCPLLVVTPSDLLRRRLKVLLARERHLSLLNVQFLTFHQLALELRKAASNGPLRLQSDLFLEEALRQMIRQRHPGAAPFAGLEERTGGCAALWQTLRDLRDGLVDPPVALEALREGHFSRSVGERTSDLLVLLQTFQQCCRRQEIADQSSLIIEATAQVPQSGFLLQFTKIIYYGFYDLTQIQLDFFHSVARRYPTLLFFPLLAAQPRHAAWSFADRFFERHLQGLDTGSSQTRDLVAPLPGLARLFDEAESRPYLDLASGWQSRIVSAFGVIDEVTAAAKEILKLVDSGEFQFNEIGVVARSLEPYSFAIRDVFHQHGIAPAGTFEESLTRFPLVKAVILLLNLRPRDFLRHHVIDLLSSPYFRCSSLLKAPALFRPDLWDLATRELAISKGAGDWRRLGHYSRNGLKLRLPSQDEEPRLIHIHGSQLSLLAELVDALAGDLLRLPDHASWREYALLWRLLLEKYLGVSRESEGNSEQEGLRIGVAVLDLLDELAELDRLQDRVSLDDFCAAFQHWVERSSVSEDRRNTDGVMVLNATAARGLSFGALFLLGMNEGVFPRTIREDAFLRDRDRAVLELDLGFKVSQKLQAFDEEKLLFTLLVGAARQRLYCSFQRADENGRALAPSWYIDELKRVIEKSGRVCEIIDIPRGMAEKSTMSPFDDDAFLPPKELIIRLSLQSQDPGDLVEKAVPLAMVYKHGRHALAEIERSGDRLLSYDGALSDFAGFWKYFTERGLSPTALETYARCPFQFFARHVLGLEPLDHPEESMGPSPAEFGELGHQILNGFYQALIETGHFAGKSAADPESLLQSIAARTFAEHEEHHAVGYALAWKSLKARMIEMIRQVIARDMSELAESGFVPAALETDMFARLPANWPEPLRNVMIRGRMDRIDMKAGALRVIDYKFKLGSKPAAQDNDLLRAALRAERLQPPFYYLLAQAWAEKHLKSKSLPSIDADFYFVAPLWPEGPLVRSGYNGEGLAGNCGAQTKQTIAYLAEGIRSGRFFMHRGAYCGHCDAAPICRKNHPPSVWRAESDPATEAHRALRKKTASDDEQDGQLD